MTEKANSTVETSGSESLAAPLLEAGLIDILQKNSDMSEGSCPWCGEEDYPVDENNKRIEGPNVENAEEWRLDHADTCAVTLIEKLLKGEHELHHS